MESVVLHTSLSSPVVSCFASPTFPSSPLFPSRSLLRPCCFVIPVLVVLPPPSFCRPCCFATLVVLPPPLFLHPHCFVTPTFPSSPSFHCPRHFIIPVILSSLSSSHSHALYLLYTPVVIPISTHNPSYKQWLVGMGVDARCLSSS